MQHFQTSALPSIELNIAEKLKDRLYRQEFFLAESSARIAKQLIALRKRRGLNQTEVATLLETGQPAISRVERADYRNWSFNTLRRLAEAMDARLRVYIEPYEDVIGEYVAEEAQHPKEYELGSAAVTLQPDYGQTAQRGFTGSVAKTMSFPKPPDFSATRKGLANGEPRQHGIT